MKLIHHNAHHLRGLLAAACPYHSGTAAWLLMGAAPAAVAPALVHTYARAFVASRPERLPVAGALDDPRAWLSEPLFSNSLIVDAAGQPLHPPPDWQPGWPLTLQQLHDAPPAIRSLPAFQLAAAALPPAWLAAGLLDPLRRGERLPGEAWLVSPCGSWVFGAAPGAWAGVSSVLAGGRLRALGEVEGARAAPVLASLRWLPACVLPVPKPRWAWSAEEAAAYASAPPQERAAWRPCNPPG